MLNKKSLFTKVAAVSMVASMMFATPVLAASNETGDKDAQNGIVKTTYEDENGTLWTEGMIGGQPEGVETYWLAYGPLYQYPSEGGTWEYGFWNAKVRSYYTVNKCHGSTVKLNSKQSRSVNTASGKKSIAELWAIQSDSNDQYFYRVC